MKPTSLPLAAAQQPVDYSTCDLEDLTRAKKTVSYRADIDGLRAVAVLAVVVYHLHDTYLPGGFVGVDMFFVISGYVVTLAMDGHHKKEGKADIVGFYARRVKRLMPALLFMICTMGLLVSVLIPSWQTNVARFYVSARFALMGFSNVFFSTLRESYFDHGHLAGLSSNPFLHTWSLGVEEQFYMVIPCLTCVVGWATGRKDSWNSALAVVLISATVCSACLSWMLTLHEPNLAFYLLPSRFWELAAGVLLCKVEASEAKRDGGQGRWTACVSSGLVSVVLQSAAVLLICLALSSTPSSPGFPFPWALPAVGGALCYIAAGSNPDSFVNRCLSHPLPVHIGNISYSVYLFHWPVFMLFKWTCGLSSPKAQLAALASAFLLAELSYVMVECPLRTWQPPKQRMIFGALLTAVCLAQCWLYALEVPLRDQLYAFLPDYPPQPSSYKSPLWTYPAGLHSHTTAGAECRPGCRVVNSTYHLPPCAQFGTEEHLPPCFVETPPQYYRPASDVLNKNCNVLTGSDPLGQEKMDNYMESCLGLHDARKSGRMFVIGHSKSEMWVPALRRCAKRLSQYSVRQFIMSGEGYGSQNFNYTSSVTKVVESMLRPGDIVAMSFQAAELENGDKFALVQALQKTLSARGAKFLILGYVPSPPAYATTCVPSTWEPDAPLKCEVPLQQYSRQHISDGAHRKFQDAPFFDPSHLFCDDKTCGAFIPGTKTLAFWDGEGHVTLEGVLYAEPFLCHALDEQRVFSSTL
mmetsp:Transcript_120765/g.352722  ORF Transcript_120765/g.352722 Transcript_120765/m.352722 type:complete len:751 (+) Transcript_120765:65-2317(+)